MNSFDEWYKEANKTKDDGFTNRDFYEAGAQSRQAEIDDLKKRIEGALKVLNDASPTMLDKKAIKILKGVADET